MSSRTAERKPLDLKRIAAKSGAVGRFLAVLRRECRDPWAARFVASGAKTPPTAPPRRIR
jgi:hypothetical protein